MELKDWVNVAVTSSGYLIAFLGVIFGAIIPLKRDSKTIDSISSDTSDIKPKVENINSTVQAIAPSIVRVEERSGKIDSVAAAVESFKYLKDHASDSTIKPEELLAHMSKVFEEKAALTIAHKNDQVRIVQLTSENKRLHEKVSSLEKSLKEERSKNRLKNNRWQDYER